MPVETASAGHARDRHRAAASGRAPAGGRRRQRALAAAEPRSAQDRLDEAVGLAKAIDLDVQAAEIVPLTRPRPATLLGSGKVHEIGLLIAAKQAGLVIIDHAVSPIQQRNLEKAWDCKVLDRTGLILEIFGERAATREGRLQVELAHLEYQKSRLVRTLDPSWSASAAASAFSAAPARRRSRPTGG